MGQNFLNDEIYTGFIQPSMETFFYEMPTEENEQALTTTTTITGTGGGRGSTTATTKTATFPNAANLYSRGNFINNNQRLKTAATAAAAASGELQLARPSTAIRAVGYTSEAGKLFDPILQAKNKKTITTWEKRLKEPQEKYKNLEYKIQTILEESILEGTGSNPNHSLALSKAKEASTLDRTLLRLRDQNGGTSYHNFDLTCSVFFNLAHQYTMNEMYVEALNTYNIMTKNKMFPNVNRLKVNMGNIYFHMGIYSKAIKMYRMALDQVPNNHKELRLKITHNIGVLFIKMGQYSDAAASFEFIVSERTDIKSAMHLILCYYAMGDVDKIKTAFRALIDVPIDYEDDIKIQTADTAAAENTSIIGASTTAAVANHQYVLETIKNDDLANYCLEKKRYAEKNILIAVDLISSIIAETYNEGYTWCTEIIKSSNFSWLANELELNKALVYLRQNEITQAIDTLRFYEKKDPSMASSALTNLTFISIYLGDLRNATKYAEKCRQIDNYNPAAFINSSVVEYLNGDLEKSKQYIEAALALDVTSFEATYNLGLIYKKFGDYEEAENIFKKLRQNLSHAKHPHIFYQLATIEEKLGRTNVALDWYLQMVGICQEMDPKLYQKIGEIYENYNDRQEANQYYNEAYRINPCDIDIASSIGSYYIKLQAIEKAIFYYERAVLSHPTDPNLMLRVVSCYKHILNSRKYFELFEKIYKQFPENLASLRALMHVSKSIGMMDEYEKYSNEYSRVERALQVRKVINSQQNNRISAKSPKIRSSNSASSLKGPNSYERLRDKSANYKDYQSHQQQQQQDKSLESLSKMYTDPLGQPSERPRTGQIYGSLSKEDSDDEINADELLPI